MESYVRTALLIALAWGASTIAHGQGNQESRLDNPVVTSAVVPTYPLTALHSHTSGEVVIEVKINSEGSVIAADAISGSPVLVGGARYIARRWKFAPATDGRVARTARLTFVYHLAPRDAPTEELFAVFKPPYRVEITRVLPDEERLPQSSSKKRMRSNTKD